MGDETLSRAARRRRRKAIRKGRMHYIKDEIFRGKVSMVLSNLDEGVKEHDATVGEALKLFCEAYEPRGQGQILTVGDLRKLNAAIDFLDEGPNKDGWFELENEHYNIVKKCIEMVGPQLVRQARNTPVLVDILEEAPTKPPWEEEELEPDVEAEQDGAKPKAKKKAKVG